MFATDVIIYASADNVEVLKQKLETCMNSVTRWYSINCPSINNQKSSVTITCSKFQLKSVKLNNLSISLASDEFQLIERVFEFICENDLS